MLPPLDDSQRMPAAAPICTGPATLRTVSKNVSHGRGHAHRSHDIGELNVAAVGRFAADAGCRADMHGPGHITHRNHAARPIYNDGPAAVYSRYRTAGIVDMYGAAAGFHMREAIHLLRFDVSANGLENGVTRHHPTPYE